MTLSKATMTVRNWSTLTGRQRLTLRAAADTVLALGTESDRLIAQSVLDRLNDSRRRWAR